MGYAIEMFFDNASESRIRALWSEFARFGASSMQDSNTRPHVSLVVAETVDLAAMRDLLDTCSRSTKSFSLSLASLGFFATSERVAYLAPKVTPDLLALHRSIYDQFSSHVSDFWPHYAPASWVPHCTLAMGQLPQPLGAAIDICQSIGLPVVCNVIELGLVEFPPVKQLYTVPLVSQSER